MTGQKADVPTFKVDEPGCTRCDGHHKNAQYLQRFKGPSLLAADLRNKTAG